MVFVMKTLNNVFVMKVEQVMLANIKLVIKTVLLSKIWNILIKKLNLFICLFILIKIFFSGKCKNGKCFCE